MRTSGRCATMEPLASTAGVNGNSSLRTIHESFTWLFTLLIGLRHRLRFYLLLSILRLPHNLHPPKRGPPDNLLPVHLGFHHHQLISRIRTLLLGSLRPRRTSSTSTTTRWPSFLRVLSRFQHSPPSPNSRPGAQQPRTSIAHEAGPGRVSSRIPIPLEV